MSHSSSCALSDEVWGVCTETRPLLQSNSSSKLLPQCGRDSECEVTGSGCGRLFPVLMELLYCPWVGRPLTGVKMQGAILCGSVRVWIVFST